MAPSQHADTRYAAAGADRAQPTVPARHPNFGRVLWSSRNRRHTKSKGCLIAKSRLRYTVHCGRPCQSRHVHLAHPQYSHWPRLLTRCRPSNMTAPVSNRTTCSSSSAGATCSLLRNWPASFSRYSKTSRCRVSQTLLTAPNEVPRYTPEELAAHRQGPLHL
jgi:hypothetical protein